MKYSGLTVVALATSLAAAPIMAQAEGELEEAELFFELNDTDGDLGIHGFADGDEWKELEIEAPDGRELLEVDVKSRLKRQGLTEIFFESAEPCFPETCDEGDDPLDPATFFQRFPQGVYEIEVETLDGEELENEVYLSHVIPAAPAGVTVNDEDAAENCDADELPEVSAPVTIAWDPVTGSHATLGKPGDVEVIYYEVVVEIDETPYKATSIVPADVNEWTLPSDFFDLGLTDDEGEDIDEYKFEILVRVDNGDGNPGNKSAMESCFVVE